MVDAPARSIPTTYDRAATELVRCRRHLSSARESLEVAVSIFRRLNGDSGIPPTSAAALEGIIGDLEQAEAALRSTTP